ncbi:hypothetical protein KC19_7G051100 [Ceratodon purpureus]|uniref:Secreted protein n=1 Tax=Ceratodon purpureus TaxID=3225 RepID=A0A8T0H7S7_CERPU|nr:hypothetical protein KC19_7G051100 [Ceratodon purpureus]
MALYTCSLLTLLGSQVTWFLNFSANFVLNLECPLSKHRWRWRWRCDLEHSDSTVLRGHCNCHYRCTVGKLKE